MSTALESCERTVATLLADNEKKMEQYVQKSPKDNHPNLSVFSCSSCWPNLLGQEITPAKVISQIVEVYKYFRNPHLPGALLSETTRYVKPQLPNDTHWKSQLSCISTSIRNRPFLLLIVAQEEDLIDVRIRSSIHSVGLYDEARHLKEEPTPVASALDNLQSDTATIADTWKESCDIL